MCSCRQFCSEFFIQISELFENISGSTELITDLDVILLQNLSTDDANLGQW